MKMKAIALQIAEHIEVKKLKQILNYHTIFIDSDEVFFQIKEDKFLYVFKYGVICVFNLSIEELDILKAKIAPTLSNSEFFDSSLFEEVDVHITDGMLRANFDAVQINSIDAEALRLVMLNLSQSVALDYYASITEKLLLDTQKYTNHLEITGSLSIGGKRLKRFIGKVLNVRNKISENLYIFDSHDLTLEDETLNKFDIALKKKFDVRDRFQVINQQLNIVKENLELFKDIMFHKESSKLEWIIILLIVIEVIDMLVLKF